MCQRRISAKDRKNCFYYKNSSYVKSKDQMYWHFKAREWCFPHCFAPLSDTENICVPFSEANSKKKKVMHTDAKILQYIGENAIK